jgi:hypothetical protein
MEWWAEPKGVRPLSGWKHVHGSISQDTAFGWIVTGRAESEKQSTSFLLKNPPQERLRRFKELKRQLPEYERARDSIRQFLSRPVYSDWYSLWLSQWSGPAISLAQYKDARLAVAELGHTINNIQAELAPMENGQGDFRLDVFALSTHESFKGIPVFDHGHSYGPSADGQ